MLRLSQNTMGHEIQSDLNEHSHIAPFSLNVPASFGLERELLLDIVLEANLTEASPRIVFTDKDDDVILDVAVNTASRNFTVTNSSLVR